MIYSAVLKVKPELAKQLEEDCRNPNSELPKDHAIFDDEVTFENGMVACIQVVTTLEPAKESCWTQGVLFTQHEKNDQKWLVEVGCSEVGESLLGEFHMDYEDDEYVVVVQSSLVEESNVQS